MKKHFPNFLTILNLLAGCMAIVAIAKGELVQASWWIILAVFMDLLDGLFARLIGATSDIGKQLDSLADVVSFGVAPGFMMYTLIGNALFDQVPQLLVSGGYSVYVYFGFIIPVFGALRLAKFNIDDEQKFDFKGLPVPVAALFILSIPIIINCKMVIIPWLNAFLGNPWALVGISIALSALMISPVNLFSLKFNSIQWKHNRGRIIMVVTAFTLFLFLRFASVPFSILIYIILSQLKLNDQE